MVSGRCLGRTRREGEDSSRRVSTFKRSAFAEAPANQRRSPLEEDNGHLEEAIGRFCRRPSNDLYPLFTKIPYMNRF